MSWNNLRKEIQNVYIEDNAVADDDKLLIAKIWARHGWDCGKSLYENLNEMPSAESIRRTRQKLVAEGLMKTSDNVREKRYRAYKDYRKEFSDYYL